MANFHEDFLHLVWKYQYFDKRQCVSEDHAELQILKIGYQNHHEGPDFKEAHIRIGNVDYFGHVEIHLKSSDWKAHDHQHDPAYNSVILHVVWEHDVEIQRKDGTTIPTLALSGKVYLDVVRNYERLLSSPSHILCSGQLESVPDILKFSMLEKSLIERMEEKSLKVLELLAENKQDWEETTYQWLFWCFGFKTNQQAMLKLAKSLPYKLIKRHSDRHVAQEALLFGQSGLLSGYSEGLFTPGTADGYVDSLVREYQFYRQKYGLSPQLYPSEWKFMGVRPANYPTIRLAQLAALLSNSPHIFSQVIHETSGLSDFSAIFQLTVSPYWHSHYHFGKLSEKYSKRSVTSGTLSLLAMNFMIPLWYAYGKFMDNLDWQEKCFGMLQEIPAESNSVTGKFEKVGWKPVQAFDSQGMIGLYNHYCKGRKCLDCKVGQSLLRPSGK
ncbi:DUF2851 family protein [Lunatimonas salinarum]|uniref:DUF2851 family protein n=1 Tax=Lunatimonas salinarum TaxID=1774590 RepID=UPI001ADF108B|nr:DUF2851 family protein [Lunatimonas salinarum]